MCQFDGLRSRERNRVSMETLQNGRRDRRRAQRREHPPAPSHESPTACARRSDARFSAGLRAHGLRRMPTYLALLPRLKPSAVCAVRSQLPLRGSPGMRVVITTRSPGSLFSLRQNLGRHREGRKSIVSGDESQLASRVVPVQSTIFLS